MDTRISFYNDPPGGEITVSLFEQCGFDRLTVLCELATLSDSGLRANERAERARHVVNKYLPLRRNNAEDVERDRLSHHVLRLAYSSPDKRDWFLRQELALMRHRLEHISDLSRVCAQNGIHYPCLSKEEFQELESKLERVKRVVPPPQNVHYFKVPFDKVADLVGHRSVLLLRGYAYVHRTDLISLILTIYREHLSRALAVTYKSFRLGREDNISKVLSSFRNHQHNVGGDFKLPNSGDRIDIGSLDALSARSFPLCMKTMHDALRTNHHLRHTARMQYSLFLKGIGVTLEDALTFWRSEMSQNVGADRFDKEYAYNIRHNYGKEGKKTNYTPYSCMKIIFSDGTAEDPHGCPFKKHAHATLESVLRRNKVPPKAVGEIAQKAREHHYQIACRMYFEALHPKSDYQEIAINHPNNFFLQSKKYHDGDAASVKGESSMDVDTMDV